jgi:predicted TIM-barrel fold metal-dependent hydrolase
VAETFSRYRDRVAPTAPIPLTNLDDAVAEIERIAGLGLRAILLPSIPPIPYFSRDLDPVWAAASANGLTVMFHLGSDQFSMSEERGSALQTVSKMVEASRRMDEQSVVDRIVQQGPLTTVVPQEIIASLVGGGVTERFPDLHFVLVEFNAHWLASLVGAMEKAYTVGIGQDPDYWVGEFEFEEGRLASIQPNMIQLFKVNGLWPYPLRPSEYVKRQIHVSFQDDPVAVACRHITGISSLVWGADYPHPEGTFGRSHDAVAALFDGVDPSEREAIVGGTMAKLVGFKV